MFINVSGRTDIAAYYSDWLMNRIREGFVYSRNPLFPHKVSKYRLDPEVVDCIIFCTKDPKPMLRYLPELRERGYAVYFFVTITSYGTDIEPRVPDYHEVMETFRHLSDKVTRNNICWRYDPILLTSKYTVDHHLQCFEEMTRELAGYTDVCIFSFVEMYRKLGYTFPELRAVNLEDKRRLLKGMSEISTAYHMRLQTCGDDNDYTAYGIRRSGCITVPILEQAIGKELKALKVHPARNGCGCIQTNDIGAYNTCPNGCRYCYATKDHGLALKNYQNHDPASPFLFGGFQDGDEISESKQRSFVVEDGQLRLEL